MFFILFILIHVPESYEQQCGAGSTYVSETTTPAITLGGWYLNLKQASSCSGIVKGYNLYFYDSIFPGNYCVYWSLWLPKNSTTYSKAINTTHKYCQYFSQSNFGDRTERDVNVHYMTLSSSEQYAVKKESIIGAFFKISLSQPPLYVVGVLADLHPNEGLCKVKIMSSINENATNLTCTSEDYRNTQVLQIEAMIDVVDCGSLSAPLNGYIINENEDTQYGAVVYYYCNENHVITNGNHYRTCLESGEWSGTKPTCTLVVEGECPYISHPDNGIATGEITTGSVVSFTCNDNYTLVGLNSIICQTNGQWSGIPPVCKMTCIHPGNIDNGYIIGNHADHSNNIAIGSVIQYVCIAGYKISGNSSIVCNSDGLWNGSLPTCLSDTHQHTNLIKALVAPTLTHSQSVVSHSQSIGSPSRSMGSPSQSIGSPSQSMDSHSQSMVSHSQSMGSSSQSMDSHSQSIGSPSRSIGSPSQSMSSVGTLALNSTDEVLNNSSLLMIIIPISTVGLVISVLVFITILILIWRLKSCKVQSNKEEKSFAVTIHKSTEVLPDVTCELHYEMDLEYANDNVRHSQMYANYEFPQDGYHTIIQNYHEYDQLTPYEAPANVEHELYIQLDRIRVKNIKMTDIQIEECLGSGHFGSVHKASWNGIPVAVKMLLDNQSAIDKIKFLQEAAIMGQFNHTNVIKLHGVVNDSKCTMLVVELMKGDLQHYLCEARNTESAKTSLLSNLLGFCRQICLGMIYLSNRGYIHRDLAARNILLTESRQCKIADFGMSRDIEQEGYYVARKGTAVPIKWTAPEALKYRKYSSASDVWSYGCVLYEIWSLGHKPFENVKIQDILKKTEEGYRLSPPAGCPIRMYELMIKCWHPDSKERLKFNDIMSTLVECEDKLVEIPDKDLSSHPQAGMIGADLVAGEKMYQDLQNTYTYYQILEQN